MVRFKKSLLMILTGALFLTGCGSAPTSSAAQSETESLLEESQTDEAAASHNGDSAASEASENADSKSNGDAAPIIEGLTYESTMALEAATEFQIYYYAEGFKLIDLNLVGSYLVVPEGKEAPAALAKNITVIKQPLDEIYLAATGVMSFCEELDVLDAVTMTGTDVSGWSLQTPIDRLNSGELIYAGKYSAPDYETLIAKDCDLALESTMILHAPEVQEMLEDLDIPVFIDRSSYELTALGRVEWIKVYGALLNKEEAAESLVAKQKAVIDDIAGFENTGKTVAFFAINSNKEVVVRKSEDFIPNMIGQAGGKYIFEDLQNPGSNSASVTINMETFYNTAVNADYLIYNATIQEDLADIQDLIDKDGLFAEFKAVKDGNVWQVGKEWYQATATAGYLIPDLNTMLTGGDESQMVFMKRVPLS